jgi:tryptophan synthase alpha subunit
VCRLADAAVVGSAFVHLIERNLNDASLEARLEAFTRELAAPLREARR